MTAPQYLHAGPTSALLSEERQMVMSHEGLSALNTFLDELLHMYVRAAMIGIYSVRTKAGNLPKTGEALNGNEVLTTWRFKAGVTKVLRRGLGKDAALEAELAMRDALHMGPSELAIDAALRSDMWAASTPLMGADEEYGHEHLSPANEAQGQRIFAELRARVEPLCALGTVSTDEGPVSPTEHIAAILPKKGADSAGFSRFGHNHVTFLLSLYAERCLTFVAEYLVRSIARAVIETSSASVAGLYSLDYALRNDPTTWAFYQYMAIRKMIETRMEHEALPLAHAAPVPSPPRRDSLAGAGNFEINGPGIRFRQDSAESPNRSENGWHHRRSFSNQLDQMSETTSPKTLSKQKSMPAFPPQKLQTTSTPPKGSVLLQNMNNNGHEDSISKLDNMFYSAHPVTSSSSLASAPAMPASSSTRDMIAEERTNLDQVIGDAYNLQGVHDDHALAQRGLGLPDSDLNPIREASLETSQLKPNVPSVLKPGRSVPQLPLPLESTGSYADSMTPEEQGAYRQAAFGRPGSASSFSSTSSGQSQSSGKKQGRKGGFVSVNQLMSTQPKWDNAQSLANTSQTEVVDSAIFPTPNKPGPGTTLPPSESNQALSIDEPPAADQSLLAYAASHDYAGSKYGIADGGPSPSRGPSDRDEDAPSIVPPSGPLNQVSLAGTDGRPRIPTFSSGEPIVRPESRPRSRSRAGPPPPPAPAVNVTTPESDDEPSPVPQASTPAKTKQRSKSFGNLRNIFAKVVHPGKGNSANKDVKNASSSKNASKSDDKENLPLSTQNAQGNTQSKTKTPLGPTDASNWNDAMLASRKTPRKSPSTPTITPKPPKSHRTPRTPKTPRSVSSTERLSMAFKKLTSSPHSTDPYYSHARTNVPPVPNVPAQFDKKDVKAGPKDSSQGGIKRDAKNIAQPSASTATDFKDSNQERREPPSLGPLPFASSESGSSTHNTSLTSSKDANTSDPHSKSAPKGKTISPSKSAEWNPFKPKDAHEDSYNGQKASPSTDKSKEPLPMPGRVHSVHKQGEPYKLHNASQVNLASYPDAEGGKPTTDKSSADTFKSSALLGNDLSKKPNAHLQPYSRSPGGSSEMLGSFGNESFNSPLMTSTPALRNNLSFGQQPGTSSGKVSVDQLRDLMSQMSGADSVADCMALMSQLVGSSPGSSVNNGGLTTGTFSESVTSFDIQDVNFDNHYAAKPLHQ